MAEGKKSFVLYADLIDLLDGDDDTEPMSDEDAGLLFKTILRYVNDLNPKIPSNISQSFTFIKKRLKADLVKYEEQKERMNRINEERKRKKEERNRNDVDTMSIKVENDVVGDKCNMLNDKCNMLNDVSKDTNNIKVQKAPMSAYEKALKDFCSMRNKIKKPLTDKAKTRLENKLIALAGEDESLKIAILNQSVDHCWQDIYELKADSKNVSSSKNFSSQSSTAIVWEEL